MCEPVSLTTAAIAASVASAGVGALSARAQARTRAKVAEQNAALKREEFALEQDAARREALNHYRRVAQLKGQQRAHAAGAGVSTDFGTAADTVFDTDMLSREDVNNLYGQSHQNLRGIDREVANYTTEARAARKAGTAAMIGGIFDMGSSFLGGASQLRQMKVNYGDVAKVPTSKSLLYGGDMIGSDWSLRG